MEKKFYTLVKKDHKFGSNERIHGHIDAYKELICDGNKNGIDEPGFAFADIPNVGAVYVTCCEPEQYDTFKKLVEKHFPGLCEFDYEVTE